MNLVLRHISKVRDKRTIEKLTQDLIRRKYTLLFNYTEAKDQQDMLDKSIAILREYKVNFTLVYTYSYAMEKYLYDLWVKADNYAEHLVIKNAIIKKLQEYSQCHAIY